MIPAFFVFLSNTGGSTLLNDATNIMNQASATCSADDRGGESNEGRYAGEPCEDHAYRFETRDGGTPPPHDFTGRRDRYGTVPQLRLHHHNQAGPLGTVIAYAIGAVIVHLVMLSLGELSVAMPETGSFHVYATKFIGPGTGFIVAILYWLTWTVALGSEFTAAGLICANGSPARRYGFGVPCSSW